MELLLVFTIGIIVGFFLPYIINSKNSELKAKNRYKATSDLMRQMRENSFKN